MTLDLGQTGIALHHIRRHLKRAACASALLAGCALLPAQATVLTFNNWTASDSWFQVQDGWQLRFSGSSFGTFGAGTQTEGVGSNAITGDGSTRLGAAGPQNGAGARITLQRADGVSTFSLQAFDAATFLKGMGAVQMLVGYTTANNIDMWTTVTVDSSFDTYFLASVGQVKRLWFTEPAALALGSSGGLSIDNIRVDEPGFTPPVTVPEPAMLALLAAAVAAAAASRRHTARQRSV